MQQTYDEKSVIILKDLEAVRLRPGMYIGNTTYEGLHHLVFEIIDNAVDESLNGGCKNIRVSISDDCKTVCVRDDGRGIPVGKAEGEDRSVVDIVFTKLHAGGKFDTGAYKISGGLHGVGSSVVNALSKELKVTVFRDGFEWHQVFQDGVPIGDIQKIRESDETGTLVEFTPDFNRFDLDEFDVSRIKKHLKERSYLIPDVLFELYHKNKYETFYSRDGILDLLKSKLSSELEFDISDIDIQKEKSTLRVVFAFDRNNESEKVLSYANGINTLDGGSHVSVFAACLSRALRNFGKDHNLPVDGSVVDELRRELVAIIDTRLNEPQFEGQTKAKLRNSFYTSEYSSILTEKLKEILEKNYKVLEGILNKCILIVRKKKKVFDDINKMRKNLQVATLKMSSKLDDCTSKKFEERELFIVEGDSAGGSLKQCRDDDTQAVLPIRGKILNVERADKENKVVKSEEILNIVAALGLNFDSDDYSRLRYSKVILLTDADADGAHIASLLLMFFYKYFPKLYELGIVYLPVPPLYRVLYGKESEYLANDAELEKFKKRNKSKKFEVVRFKGLGEMNPEQLGETCVSKKSRLLKKVVIEDFEKVGELVDILYGADSEKRRKFIQENVHMVDEDFKIAV